MTEERQWTHCRFCGGRVSYVIGDAQTKSKLSHELPLCARFIEIMNSPGMSYSLGATDENGERQEVSGVWERPKQSDS